MTRKECLEQAMGCVLRDRQKQYGEPEDCFETIAMMWSAYLGKIIQGWDVATMMALLKIARIKANPAHADNWCDLAGYAACGAECRQKFEAEMKKTVEDAFETFPHLKPEANAEPEFNPRDRVQAKMSDGKWRDAFVSGKEIVSGTLHYTVSIYGFDGYYSLPAEDIRPAPKAEGCEALVEHDAPQTPAELYDKIIASNPATFGRPRTPTGEELAEMAEEDSHG